MNRTVSEIIAEVEAQTRGYVREQMARHPPERQRFDSFEELDEELNRLKREYPEAHKHAVIYALVESYSDQAELLRLCKYCSLRYLCCAYWLDDCLYVDTNVQGNKHPPAWTELLENIEKGVSRDGGPRIEVLCMFQSSPGIADFCRQHNVKLVIPK